jgi:hypothetical protein
MSSSVVMHKKDELHAAIQQAKHPVNSTSLDAILAFRLPALAEGVAPSRWHIDGPDVVLWHIDTEGAEIQVLRSAAALFRERRIKRVIVEVTPRRWGKFGITPRAGFRELGSTFDFSWRCVVICSGKTFMWDKPPSCHGVNKPWVRAAQRAGVWSVDVYCVVKELELNDPGLRILRQEWELQSAS